MSQAYFNIAVGFILLLFAGFEWHKNGLNIYIFIIALIHLVVGLLMASVGHHPGIGIRYYIFTQQEQKNNFIITCVDDGINAISTFIGLEIYIAVTGLIILFVAPHKGIICQISRILVMQAIFIFVVFIFLMKIQGNQ